MLQRITRSSFVRNIAIVASGQALAQGLAVAASPILTRLYHPDAFGAFGILLSLAALGMVLAGLRYELAIVLQKDDGAASNLLALSWLLVLFTFVVLVLLLGAAGGWITVQIGNPDLGSLLWWLPVLIIMSGSHESFSYWTIRRKHFKLLASARVLQSLVMIGAQIAAGMASFGAAGLAGGRIVGGLTGLAILGVQTWRQDRSVIREALSLREMVRLAKEHSRFPKYTVPQNLLSSFSKSVILFTLGALFGLEVVGFYWLADRVLNAPSGLIAVSVRRVFFQRASELHNEKRDFGPLLNLTTAGLAAMGIVPLIILVLYGPVLFSLVFGAEWSKAGVYTQWLAVWWFFVFINAPAAESIIIMRIQKYFLFYEFALSTARILAIIVGGMLGDDLTGIIACSIVGAVFSFFLTAFVLVFARIKWRSVSTQPE